MPESPEAAMEAIAGELEETKVANVLVVDDNSRFIDELKERAVDDGLQWNVISAHSPSEARKIIKEGNHRIDCLLVDVEFDKGGENGIEFLRTSRDIIGSTLVYVLSDYPADKYTYDSFRTSESEWKNLGAVDWLSKADPNFSAVNAQIVVSWTFIAQNIGRFESLRALAMLQIFDAQGACAQLLTLVSKERLEEVSAFGMHDLERARKLGGTLAVALRTTEAALSQFGEIFIPQRFGSRPRAVPVHYETRAVNPPPRLPDEREGPDDIAETVEQITRNSLDDNDLDKSFSAVIDCIQHLRHQRRYSSVEALGSVASDWFAAREKFDLAAGVLFESGRALTSAENQISLPRLLQRAFQLTRRSGDERLLSYGLTEFQPYLSANT